MSLHSWISAFALAMLACNQSTLVELPDSGSEEDACVPHAVTFCDASSTGCVGGDSTDPNASLLPTDASFPVGCTANVVGSMRDPVTGYCALAASCTCAGDAGPDASAQWVCTP